jgi:hypothetical protein
MWCFRPMFAPIWLPLRRWWPLVLVLALVGLPTHAFAQASTEFSVVGRHAILGGQSDNSLVAMLTLPLGTARVPGSTTRPVPTTKKGEIAAEPPPEVPPIAPQAPPRRGFPASRAVPQDSILIQRLLDGALRTSGLAQALERLSSLAARQRNAALLPTVMLRAGRNADLRATSTTDDLGTTNEDATTAARVYYEARLTFRLDRVAAGDDEATLERLRQDLIAQRTKLFREVIGELNRRNRALRILQATDDTTVREEALDDATAANATLFALTGITLPLPESGR